MKLKAKIFPKYLKEILEGRKHCDFRQIESITLVNSETGEEHDFEVPFVIRLGQTIIENLKTTYPDIDWKDDLETLSIGLGVRLGGRKH